VAAYPETLVSLERLLLFTVKDPPALIFAIGFIQSRRKFCLAYGLMGTFNFGPLGKLSKVATPEDRKADRKTAISILVQALALALTITLIIYLFPL
jgi:hypothetical protein